MEEFCHVRPTHSLNSTALQYCLANPTVASVVAGASSSSQLRENVKAVEASRFSLLKLASCNRSLEQINTKLTVKIKAPLPALFF
ncbi:aldo/keto reductase [Priestia megaterium]